MISVKICRFQSFGWSMSYSFQATLKAAFMHSLPILAGFLFLGAAYGVYMRSLGFDAWYPIILACIIFAGSVEFITAGILLTAFSPIYTAMLILMISARQIFYSISMLEKFRYVQGWKKFYLISAMTDESFAINYSAQLERDIDPEKFMLWVTLFLHIYWVSGAAIGSLLSDIIPFNLKGSEFAMTALFIVIFMEQWLKEKSHESSLIGIGVTLMALLIFGQSHFLIPAMLGILLMLTFRRHILEMKYSSKGH